LNNNTFTTTQTFMDNDTKTATFENPVYRKISEASTYTFGKGVWMPFPTSYRLSREQEEAMVDYLLKRCSALEAEQGRDLVVGRNNIFLRGASLQSALPGLGNNRVSETSDYDRFMVRQERYTMMFDNELGWRSWIIGTIFENSNLNLQVLQRFVFQMIAKMKQYYFEHSPWFGCDAVGLHDAKMSFRLNKYLQWKFKKNSVSGGLEDSIQFAPILGQAVVKTGYRRQIDLSWSNKSVLVAVADVLDLETGDLLAASGDPIPHPDTGDVIVEGDPAGASWDGGNGSAAVANYVPMDVPTRNILFDGVENKVLNFKDFLCPLDAPTVDDAPEVFHLYDEPLWTLIDRFMRREADWGVDRERKEIMKVYSLLSKLMNNGPEGHSGYAEDVRIAGGDSTGSTAASDRDTATGSSICQIVECCARHDFDGDGIEEEVVVWIDRKSKVPISYDYLSNLTADGKRPYSVVKWSPTPYWFGSGAVKLFEEAQKTIDLFLNRMNFSQSQAGRIDIIHPENTLKGRDSPSFKINYGDTVVAAPGKRADDIIESVYLNDIKSDELHTMIEMILQVVQPLSGVASVNDSQMAGLDSAKLATGVRNIEASGNELFSYFIGSVRKGLEECLLKSVKTQIRYWGEGELTDFFNGEDQDPIVDESTGEVVGVRTLFGVLNADTVRDIEFNCTFSLTKYFGEQRVTQLDNAIAVGERYFQQPVPVQEVWADVYRQRLNALNANLDADALIVPGLVDPIANAIALQGANAPGLNRNTLAMSAPRPSKMALGGGGYGGGIGGEHRERSDGRAAPNPQPPQAAPPRPQDRPPV
jgi:hypothetical protein